MDNSADPDHLQTYRCVRLRLARARMGTCRYPHGLSPCARRRSAERGCHCAPPDDRWREDLAGDCALGGVMKHPRGKARLHPGHGYARVYAATAPSASRRNRVLGYILVVLNIMRLSHPMSSSMGPSVSMRSTAFSRYKSCARSRYQRRSASFTLWGRADC